MWKSVSCKLKYKINNINRFIYKLKYLNISNSAQINAFYFCHYLIYYHSVLLVWISLRFICLFLNNNHYFLEFCIVLGLNKERWFLVKLKCCEFDECTLAIHKM